MVYIKEIRLINCQSWEDGLLKLADGLNVIIAPNNTGKSVLFKILKQVTCPGYYSKEEVGQLIRWGADYASPIFLFSDGSLCVVRIYRNRTLYNWAEDYNNLQFVTYQDIPPKRLIENLGMIVEYTENFIANISDINQHMLLVNSDEKSNYNLIKLLTTNEDLTGLITNTQEKMGYLKTKLVETQFIRDRLVNKKNSLNYVDITELEYTVNYGDVLLSTLRKLLPLYATIDDLDRNLGAYRDTTPMVNVCDLLLKLEDINSDTINENVKPVDERLINSVDFVLHLSEIESEMESISDKSLNLEDNELLYNCCLYIEDLMQVVNHLNDYQKIQDISLKQQMIISESEIALDLIEGEVFDCPIYGRIKHTDGKCIPINN